MDVLNGFIMGCVNGFLDFMIIILSFLLGDMIVLIESKGFMLFTNLVVIAIVSILVLLVLIGVICKVVGVEPGEIDRAVFEIKKNIYKKYFLRE